MRRELAESESRVHWLAAQREVLEAQKQMAEQETRLYAEKGKAKSRRDQLQVRTAVTTGVGMSVVSLSFLANDVNMLGFIFH